MDTEKLIQDLINTLRLGQGDKRAIIQKAKAEKDSLAALEKLTAEYKKQLENLKKQGNLNKEDLKILNEVLKVTEHEIDQKKINLEWHKRINRANKTLLESFVGLADAGTAGGEKISYYTGAFREVPLVGNAIHALGKSLDFNINNFRLLADAGADFGKSLIGLRLQARDGLLPLTEFIDFIGNNTSAIAGLFGSVNNGTQAVSLLQRSIRAQLIPELAGLGLTTENLNEFLGTFFEIQRVQGRQEYLNQTQSIESLRQYSLQLDAVAKLTGIQRSNLDKLVKQQKDDSVFQTFLQGLDTERATQLQTFVAGLQGLNPALGDAVKNILATGFPLGEFESMLVGTTDGLFDNILALREGRTNVGQFAQALAGSSNDFLKSFSPEVLRAAGSVGEVGNSLIAFRRRFDSLNEIQRQQLLNGDALTGQLGETQEAFRKLKATFEGLNTAGLQTISTGLGPILYGVQQLTEGTNYVLEQTQKHWPEMAAGLSLFANAAQYIYPEAKQIAIIAAGNKLAQPGMLRGFGEVLGKGLMPLIGISAAIVSVATFIRRLSNIFKDREDGKGPSMEDVFGIGGAVILPLLGSLVTRGKLSMSQLALLSAGGGYAGGLVGKGIDTIQGRAGGGPVMQGQIVKVGEGGVESFIPSTDGYIANNNQTKKMIEAAGTDATPAFMDTLNKFMSQQTALNKANAESLARNERYLKSIADSSARTVQNTGQTARKIGNYNADLLNG